MSAVQARTLRQPPPGLAGAFSRDRLFAARTPQSRAPLDCVTHFQRHQRGLERGVLHRNWVVEDHHNAVARVTFKRAAGAAIGISRMIVVANSDEEARRFGKPALDRHVAHLTWLRDRLANIAGLHLPFGVDYDAWLANGTAIAGTPDKVRAEIERQTKELGVNLSKSNDTIPVTLRHRDR
jgi:hypothetical protein